MYKAIVKVIETNGCPVYQVGQKMVFEDDQVYEANHKICWRGMQPIVNHLSLLMRGIELQHGELPDPNALLMQCSECGEPITDKGPVLFEVRLDKGDKKIEIPQDLRYRIRARIERIDGYCAIHKVGDEFVIDEPTMRITSGEGVCFPMLANLMTVFRPLARGIPPADLGLGEEGIICCHDAGPRVGYSGTVYFTLYREPAGKLAFDQLNQGA